MKPVQLIVLIIWGALCTSLLVYAGMLNAMTFDPAKADTASTGVIMALARKRLGPEFSPAQDAAGWFHHRKTQSG
jgi:hypothetical protein